MGGRLVEFTGREYMVRGRGYIRSLDDINNIVVSYNAQTGTPVLVRDVATVAFGPDLRRGAAAVSYTHLFSCRSQSVLCTFQI